MDSFYRPHRLGYVGTPLQLITIRWRYMSKSVDGEPVVIVMNGKIMEEAMKKARYRAVDLMGQLRCKMYLI